MRDVGRKLAAERLTLLPLRDVHQQQHRTGRAAKAGHGVRRQLPDAVRKVQQRLGVRTGQGRFHRARRLRRETRAAQVRRVLWQGEERLRAVVAGENVPVCVQQQKALAHLLGDRGKFLLPPRQLRELEADGAVLLADAGGQRPQLRIDGVLARRVEVDLVDGAGDLPSQPERDGCA